jgi:hypothetical protein
VAKNARPISAAKAMNAMMRALATDIELMRAEM